MIGTKSLAGVGDPWGAAAPQTPCLILGGSRPPDPPGRAGGWRPRGLGGGSPQGQAGGLGGGSPKDDLLRPVFWSLHCEHEGGLEVDSSGSHVGRETQ